jgi:hypothetical protein
LRCTHGSRDFHPFQAFADAVKNAQSLSQLEVSLQGETFPRDPSGLNALASALLEHTGLQEFTWIDMRPPLEAAQSTAFDHVLRALPACPHLHVVFILTNFASADTIRNLLQLPTDTILHLALTPDHWLAVADEIRLGHCLIKTLCLSMLQSSSSKATEAFKVVASAIRWDRHLKHLYLQMGDDFTDEAGVTLAEALTVNKTLLKIILSTNVRPSAPTYEAFSAMLRVNTSLVLKLDLFETDGADERLVDSHNQMRIEQGLNEVGRGRLLSSSQTRREEWVDALHESDSGNVDESPAFGVSCLFSVLRSNPTLVCMS